MGFTCYSCTAQLHDGNLNGSYTHTIEPAPSAKIEYLWQVDTVQETLVDAYVAGCTAFVQDENLIQTQQIMQIEYGK